MEFRGHLVVSVVLAAACGGGASASEPSAPAPATAETAADAPTATAPPRPPATATAPPVAPVATAPRGLSCLAQHYVGAAAQSPDGSWILRLPSGAELPWNDGKTKTFEQTLDGPDLKDTFSVPYLTGPITPVSAVNHDPGRFRQEALFKATFGDSSSAVKAKLVDVDFVGQTLAFHARAAAALGRVSTRLKTLIAATPSLSQYVTGDLGGTFSWRAIANTSRMSAHSYGVAIDIVVGKSDYWEWEKTPDGSLLWTNKIPQSIVDAFEAEGFAWGGRWYHYDTMHFEYRPELFDPACR